MNAPLQIFVLADTHDHLPPGLSDLAEGADEIWHLGDVCAPALLEQIRSIGLPLTVVRGNCDTNDEWPLAVTITRNGVRFRLIHIPPRRAPEEVDVLLHGHTHVPRDEVSGGVRFLNPGCVTRPNQGAPASTARLTIDPDGRLTWRTSLLR